MKIEKNYEKCTSERSKTDKAEGNQGPSEEPR